MPREGVEVAAQLPHIDRSVPGGLGSVDQGGDSLLPGPGADPGHRIDQPQAVGDVHQGEQPGGRGQQPVESLLVQGLSVAHHRAPGDLGSGPAGQDLPGHQVAVVLHLAEHDPVPRPDAVPSPGGGHQVDGLGGPAHEHHLPGVLRAQEAGGAGPGPLVGLGGPVAQLVDAAVDVGVVAAVVAVQRLQHLAGTLAGGRAVEVGQRAAVYLLGQDGEVLPHPVPVDGPRCIGGAHGRLTSAPAGAGPPRSSSPGSTGAPRPARRWPRRSPRCRAAGSAHPAAAPAPCRSQGR